MKVLSAREKRIKGFFVPDENFTISQRVREVRRKRGVTLQDVERRSNGAISLQTLSKLETGKQTTWTIEHLSAVATALEVEIADLLPSRERENPALPPTFGEVRLLKAVRAHDWREAITVLAELANPPNPLAEAAPEKEAEG